LTAFLFSFALFAANENDFLTKGEEALSKEDYENAIFYLNKAMRAEPDRPEISGYLGTAYNNLALKLFEGEETEKAMQNMETALDIDPGNTVFRENAANILYTIAVSKYKNRDFPASLINLDKALIYNATDLKSLLLKGEISYYSQNMENAEESWRRALAIDPSSQAAKDRLAKLENEMPVESNFKQIEGVNFDIRFDRNDGTYDAYAIKDFLREAYRDIGRDLGYYPNHTIVVIAYSEESGKEALFGLPLWSEGVFDGKIRLPAVNKGEIDERRLKGILWHEYTHALIFDLTLGNCPAWLNEGIAVYEEAKYQQIDIKPLLDAYAENRLMGIRQLADSFSGIEDRDKAFLAYMQSYTMVEYFIERYGFWYLTRLLEALKEQDTIDEAMRETVLITPDDFEKEWLKFVKEKSL